MEDTIMCPVCKINLEYTEFRLDGFDGEYAWFKSSGHCPECGRKYCWFEKFKFVSASELGCVGEKEQ